MVDNKMAKVNTISESVNFDEKALAIHAVREMPNIASVSVSKSSKVHIGPKIVAVNQTVENKEMIKDLPLGKYLWMLIKNTNRTERLSCLAAVCALCICIGLILFYTLHRQNTNDQPGVNEDYAPHEWRISREMWLAQKYPNFSTTEEYHPLKLVVIWHTAGSECFTFDRCATELRSLQEYYLVVLKYDIPYNFLIGNDGRVYEGRGWNREGAHTFGYNRCAIGIGFMGDYREELPVHTKVTQLQLDRLNLLLQEGVEKGFLTPDYHIVGSNDLRVVETPTNLYNAIRKLDHYDHSNRYANKNCSVIYSSD